MKKVWNFDIKGIKDDIEGEEGGKEREVGWLVGRLVGFGWLVGLKVLG